MSIPADPQDLRQNAVVRYRRGTLLAILILLTCFGGTITAWRSDQKQAFDRARGRFQREIDRVRLSILARLELYEDSLYATRSFFEANPRVTRRMFRKYIEHLDLDDRYPGIQGIGYAERLSPQKLHQHVHSVRNEGFSQYHVWPEGNRPEYTAILFLEPFDWRNQRAFGYDMFSEPTRRKAMEYACDTGKTAISAKVRLVQETETDVQPGFLMYLPLYKEHTMLNTTEQRRAALQGYIYSPFRMRTLMLDLIPERTPLASFEVHSGNAAVPESLMYSTSATNVPGFRQALLQTAVIDFGGEKWVLVFRSSPEFARLVHENANPFLLPAGIVISLLLFGITLAIARTEKRAIHLADQITARLRETEKSILSMNQQLTDALYKSEKLAISGRLVATVAHEINNPLEALVNIVFILKKSSPQDTEWKVLIDNLEDQISVLANISRQTLTPFRSTAFPVSTNISELLDDVLALFRPRLIQKEIRIERNYPPQLEVTVFSSELRQVFTNLIANAIDAMSSGGHMGVSVTSSKNSVSVEICDDGEGIRPDRLETIFEPFFTTKGDSGTGIGLWVVKRILDKLHGRIDVESSVASHSHGTRFTVTIPSPIR
jgi:signal transduction histidine kinase